MTNTQLQPIAVRIKEACRMTGIGRSKLYELIAEGEIEIVKVGAITLVPVAGLQAFLERSRERR
jgi:excisionase family DNA binding protein